MNIDSVTQRFQARALFVYLAAFAAGRAFGVMPRDPFGYLALLLCIALALLLYADSRIRRALKLETTLVLGFDALARQGWLLMLALMCVGAFLEPRVRTQNWLQPWLYVLVTFFWVEAFVATLKYFRRTK